MVFIIAGPNEDYAVRFVSWGNRWQIGLSPVIFGHRVRVSLVGSPTYEFDYCAASQFGFAINLLEVIKDIMETFDEAIEPSEIKKLLPSYEIRPINLDQSCWPELLRLRRQLMEAGGNSDKLDQDDSVLMHLYYKQDSRR
jgi:hypothetical protein